MSWLHGLQVKSVGFSFGVETFLGAVLGALLDFAVVLLGLSFVVVLLGLFFWACFFAFVAVTTLLGGGPSTGVIGGISVRGTGGVG